MIRDYSDEDPEVQRLISAAVLESSSTPREVKRLMNMFRFQYFILLARRAKGLDTPKKEHLMRWIILSLKWPELVRWIQWTPPSSYALKHELKPDEHTTFTRYNLMQLEKLGMTCKNYSEWQKRVEIELASSSGMDLWMNDDGIRIFFNGEGARNNEDRLSTSAGKGLY